MGDTIMTFMFLNIPIPPSAEPSPATVESEAVQKFREKYGTATNPKDQ